MFVVFHFKINKFVNAQQGKKNEDKTGENIFFCQYDTVFEKRLHNNPVYHSFKIFTHSYTQANC